MSVGVMSEKVRLRAVRQAGESFQTEKKKNEVLCWSSLLKDWTATRILHWDTTDILYYNWS